MSDTPLVKSIHQRLPGLRLLCGEPLSRHCSFRIGGPADVFAEPESEAQLLELAALLREEGVPTLLLGKGTNWLISGAGFRGVVIHPAGELCGAVCEGSVLRAGAGISMARLAVLAQQQGLTGLEFAHGIPGTLGGAVLMNAGAYGGEMKDVVARVRALGPDGAVREYTGEACGFSYRRSRFEDSGEIVLSAELSLTPGDGEAIAARMRELMARRSASQPLDLPSAGSTFKRPATGYAAAMIDGAGLKGYTVGGAQVSEKHAGFVVNRGGASFEDVLAVMDHVRETVREAYGVELEPEVRILYGD